ncbi:hypothetical protein ABZ942_18515 [Nocardia sp. NPDC046473]|uniref:hypothetical protein n=1 Tax=Nocardia sp. NPDC046473 TaxID=3155733 RepID=UPI003405E754
MDDFFVSAAPTTTVKSHDHRHVQDHRHGHRHNELSVFDSVGSAARGATPPATTAATIALTSTVASIEESLFQRTAGKEIDSLRDMSASPRAIAMCLQPPPSSQRYKRFRQQIARYARIRRQISKYAVGLD